MDASKAKKSIYNVLTSVIGQVITIAMGIVIPRLVLVNLGSENNGLLSSITQALGYASLLEAGVGLASLQALYKPVAERDRPSVNAILSATNLYYQRTGLAYLLIVAKILFLCIAVLRLRFLIRLFLLWFLLAVFLVS